MDAPLLKRLSIVDPDGPTTVRVIQAPKLTLLGYSAAEFSQLVIGSITVQVQQSFSSSFLATRLPNSHIIANKSLEYESHKLDLVSAHSEDLGIAISRPQTG